MFRNTLLAFAVVFGWVANHASAQPAVQYVRPAAVTPGQSVEIVVVGDKFAEPLRVWNSLGANVEVLSVAATEAKLKVTLPADVPLGPFGLTVATADGNSLPVSVLVDELPNVAEAADNHELAKAQVIPDRCGVDSLCDGPLVDFFRLNSTNDQKLTIEVRSDFLGGAMDPVVRVLDASGNEIAVGDDQATTSEGRVCFPAAKGTDYIVEVRDSKYAAGGRYRLRVGAYPDVRVMHPGIVQSGVATNLAAIGLVSGEVAVANVNVSADAAGSLVQIPVRSPEYNSSTWGTVAATTYPVVLETENGDAGAASSVSVVPVALAGRLQAAGDTDRFALPLKKGVAVRCSVLSASLGSPALVRLKMFHPDGRMLAESPVNEASEWRLEFTPPDEGVYQLQVEELLQRGGADYTYAVQIETAGIVIASLKADANSRDRFLLGGAAGVFPLDFQLERFGYEGPVQIGIKQLPQGLQILNSVAAAGAKEWRVWVATNGSTVGDVPTGEILRSLHWTVRPQDIPAAATSLSTRGVWRVRQPTVPYPPAWRDGLVLVSTAKPGDPFFKVSPTESTVRFAAGAKQIQTVLKLERLNAEYKEVPQWFVTAVPAGVTAAVVMEGDQAKLTIDRVAENKVVSGTLELSAVAEFGGRGRRETVALQLDTSADRLEVFPSEIALQHAGDKSQMVVTAHFADGSFREVTHSATLKSSNEMVALVDQTRVIPKGDGTAELRVEALGASAVVPVQVQNAANPKPIGFETGALVALTKQNCNSGACHGSPSGKGGFRLSLRAFDPVLDQLTLLREETGRRVNVLDPEQSLLLTKPLMKVAHGGGTQIRPSDAAYKLLKQWISEGAKNDPADAPKVTRVEIYPSGKRVLRKPNDSQQIAVIAHMSDGSKRDVSDIASYSVSNTSVCSVNADGLVRKMHRGESAVLVRYMEHVETLTLTFVDDIGGFAWQDSGINNYIDEKVYDKLKLLQYQPSATAKDSEFLRRVYLDVIGLLPTPEESQAFLADTDPAKRSKLIDRLLERPEYARFWAIKWGDLLKMTSKKIGADGLFKYHRWVEDAIRKNMPYDQFARELLTANGSSLVNPPANFYKAATNMNDCVETISQVFLGSRLQCAKCHNHPFERWTQDNYYGMGAFFERVQRKATPRPNETFVWTSQTGEVTQPRTGKVMQPWVPVAGTLTEVDPLDRRRTFADWLVKGDNPYFAKMEVNRIWAQLFSRGIVDPIDDFRDSNPPCNAELLDALAADFVKSGYDRKHILRTILNSRTYQASFEPLPSNIEDEIYFSHQIPRLLSAEQLMDAVGSALAVAEPFASLPPDRKATQLPAPDLVKVDFLKVFGQPERETVCACERSKDTNLGMAIEFFNGSFLHGRLKNPQNRFRQALAGGKPTDQVVREMYLAAVCRPPNDAELQAAMKHISAHTDPAAAMEDICWALVNTDEFIFQH